MRPDETCPTCGTKLGPLHERAALRRCDACQRPNPRGFRYCGFCAAPLESEAEHAERVEVAAPPGGWPMLSRELVELRFFLDRGELDEAYELLSILHRRHPGHPALVEFNRGSAARQPRPDTHVHQVVDAVLADSSSLSSSSLPRRSVPQWNAPTVDDGEEGKKTRAHAVVPLGNEEEEEPTSRRARPKTLEPKPPALARSRTDKHHGAVPVAKGEAAAKRGKSGATRAYGAPVDERPPKKAASAAHEERSERPERPKKVAAAAGEERERLSKKAAARASAQTVVVSTLQPPKPFASMPPASSELDEEARPTQIMTADEGLRAARAAKKAAAAAQERPREPAPAPAPKKPEKGALRKRMLEPELASAAKAIEPKKRTGKQAAVPKPTEPEPAKKRSHGARFGQNVLGRFGKGKG
jgi:hypothetical protein